MQYNVRENNPNWGGGKSIDPKGKALVLYPQHPRANNNGYVFEHILIAERALGKKISKDTPIHHINENISDNHNSNLVVCESHAYHKFLHCRKRALEASGNKNWRKCRECKRYDDPKNMSIHTRKKHSNVYIHKKCHALRMARWRKKNPDYWRKFYKYEKGGGSHSASEARL